MYPNYVIEVSGPAVKMRSNKSKIIIHYPDDYNALIIYDFIVQKINHDKKER